MARLVEFTMATVQERVLKRAIPWLVNYGAYFVVGDYQINLFFALVFGMP